MKSKFILLFLLIVLQQNNAISQTKETANADKLYKINQYKKAILAYKQLLENDSNYYVTKQIGYAYASLSENTEAVKWFKKASSKEQEAEFYFDYAQQLKAVGDYKEANLQLKKFALKNPKDKRAGDFNENPNYIDNINKQRTLFEITTLNINSVKSDFGGTLQDGILYFSSARNNQTQKTNSGTLDIFKSVLDLDGSLSQPSEIKELNTKWNEGPISFGKNGQTLYFTSEGFIENGNFTKDKKLKSKFSTINLYSATIDKDNWTNKKLIPINKNGFSISNPSISPDGKTLYFSSDKEGGYGGIDIWKATINNDGSFGEPQNLGNQINTASNESFPFIAQDNSTLYFASNGLLGLGGYDVFVINLNDKSAPKNLGKPINSEKDDFAFTYYDKDKIGFVSSNRSGNDDIFKISKSCSSQVIVSVTNEENASLISDANVTILNSKKEILNQSKSDAMGKTTFDVDCSQTITLSISKEGFESETVTFESNTKSVIDVKLKPIITIIKPIDDVTIFNDLLFDYNAFIIKESGYTTLEKIVAILTEKPSSKILIKAHTDNRGTEKYNQQLSEKRAKAVVNYFISKGIKAERITAKAFGESDLKIKCDNDCTEEDNALNRRIEFIIN